MSQKKYHQEECDRMSEGANDYIKTLQHSD